MRSLACALLVVSTVYATKVCEPGAKKLDDPNVCFCLGDGSGWICVPSDDALPLLSNPSPIRQTRGLKETKDTCEPGKRFKNYCNTCFCGNDGLARNAACTLMECNPQIWNRDGSLKESVEIAKTPVLRELRAVEESDERCEPGKRFKYYCNSCFCGNDGKVGNSMCTYAYCDLQVWNKDGTLKHPNQVAKRPLLRETREIDENEDTCEPRKGFKYYCNTCACADDGKVAHSACTKMYCDPGLWNKDGTLKLPTETDIDSLLRNVREAEENDDTCEPGKGFKYYCNTCACADDGKVAHSICTAMYCEPNLWNKDGTLKLLTSTTIDNLPRETREIEENEDTCEPGRPFRYYCNSCACADDGKVAHSVCTRMSCDPNLWNRDGTLNLSTGTATDSMLRKIRETEENEDTCEPGKGFKYYCNTCACADDGKVANSICTAMYCDPNLWNKDGTVKLLTSTTIDTLPRETREIEENEDTCEPRRPFRYYCNTCACANDGKVAHSVCTKMYCDPALWNKDGSLKIPTDPADNSLMRKERETEENEETCEPGKGFKYYCNTCACADDGKVAHSVCTKMYCDPELWNKAGTLKLPTGTDTDSLLRNVREAEENEETCEPGKGFKYYCNTCACADDGKVAHSVCTKMYCDPALWNKDGSLKISTEPADNSLLRKERETEERCEPGRTFNDYCNKCICSLDGKVAHSPCTQMYCDPAQWNKDGTEKSTSVNLPLLRNQRSADSLCQPGKVYKNDCNTCLCSRNGKSSVCTQMLCLPQHDQFEAA